jgi:hypothetical protein
VAALVAGGSCTLALQYPAPRPENPANDDCNDGVDNDLNGLIDAMDPGCPTDESTPTLCADHRDDDGDGLTDYFDPGCWPFAHIEVTRCTRVNGVNLSPAPVDVDTWTGNGRFDQGAIGWQLSPITPGVAPELVLIPDITGDIGSLVITLDLALGDGGAAPAPIVTLVSAHDVAVAPPPDLSTVSRIEIATGAGSALLGLRQIDVNTGTSAMSTGTSEAAVVHVVLELVNGGARLRARTNTQDASATLTSALPWTQADALRLVWSAPSSVELISLEIATTDASTCRVPALSPQFDPPLGAAIASAYGHGTVCSAFGAPPVLVGGPGPSFAASGDLGSTWTAPAPFDARRREAPGVVWDESSGLFRAVVDDQEDRTIALSSSDCRTWTAGASTTLPATVVLGYSVGFTMLDHAYEIWWDDRGQLAHATARDPALADLVTTGLPESLVMTDGVSLLESGSTISVTRVGSDRVLARDDGASIDLVVATALEGGPVTVRRPAYPLLAPSGVDGTFDEALGPRATLAILPSDADGTHLLLVYSGARSCAAAGCGAYGGTATVTISPP